jgi:hypothetical protein
MPSGRTSRVPVGLAVSSNGDPETRRRHVGAPIGSGAVDAPPSDTKPGAGARLTRDGDRAVNIIDGSHVESHPGPFRLTPHNDCPRGRADDVRRDQVERKTRHCECALPGLRPMPRPIVCNGSERACEHATARRPRIDSRPARDRERLCLGTYVLDEDTICCLAHRDIDRPPYRRRRGGLSRREPYQSRRSTGPHPNPLGMCMKRSHCPVRGRGHRRYARRSRLRLR